MLYVMLYNYYMFISNNYVILESLVKCLFVIVYCN